VQHTVPETTEVNLKA